MPLDPSKYAQIKAFIDADQDLTSVEKKEVL